MWPPPLLENFGAAVAGVQTPRYNALYSNYIINLTIDPTHSLFFWCRHPSNCSPFVVEFGSIATDLNDICSKTKEQLRTYLATYQDAHAGKRISAWLWFLGKARRIGVSKQALHETRIQNYMKAVIGQYARYFPGLPLPLELCSLRDPILRDVGLEN